MALIDEIIEFGKKAVIEFNNKSFDKFDEYMEKGFNIYPKVFEKEDPFFDIGYRYIKMGVKNHLDNKNLKSAKKWLDRLVDFNKIAYFSNEEVGFYCGKYYFEDGNLDEAYKHWREVVRQSGKNHFRFFEGEDKKYLDFYKARKKLEDKK